MPRHVRCLMQPCAKSALLATGIWLGLCWQASAQVQIGSIFNSQGPGPAIGDRETVGSADNPPNGTVTGAVQAIAADPLDPNILYLGAVDGGIWKSVNAGASWTPLTDQKSSLSIASLTLDPTDPTHKTLIAGNGNTSNGGFTSISTFSTPGNFGGVQAGLLYSTDGGASFTRLGGAALSGQSVVDVAARGGTILAATFEPRLAGAGGSIFSGGLFRSTDHGATFAQVATASGLPSGPVTSLVGDPANPSIFYAAVAASSNANFGQTGIYRSTDGGATWSAVFGAAQSGGTITNASPTSIKLTAGPGGTIAAGVIDLSSGKLAGLFYSSTGGAAFTALSVPSVTPGGQAPVNIALAIDPTSPNLVYVMGDNNFNFNGGINALAIVRVDATTNTISGLSDDSATPVNTANGSTVHPDGRAFAFDAAGRLLIGSDGGIYARTHPQDNTGVFQGLNTSLSTMELYSVAYDANSKRLLVAAQDNGTSGQTTPGGLAFTQIQAGDGINARINDTTLGTTSALYTSSQFLGGLTRTIVDAQGNAIAAAPVSLDSSVVGLHFTSPLVLNNIDPTRIALAGSRVYVTQDTLSGANSPGAASVDLNLTQVGRTFQSATTLDYGTRNNVNAVLVGAGQGNDPVGAVFISTTATFNSLVSLPAYAGLAPTSVKFDLRSDSRFFVADSQDLFGSTNQGATFQTLTGNLPASFIRPTSLGFIDANGVDALLVGGLNNADDAGNPLVVADSDAAGALSGWRRFGSGLPNTTVSSLLYNAKSDTLAIGTIGRGAYLLYDVTSNFASALVLQFGLADNDSIPDPAVLFGARPLVKYGPGTLTINGASTYTGSSTVLAGIMRAGAANVLAPASAFLIAAGAKLDLNNFSQGIGSLAGAGHVTLGSATLTSGNDNTSTLFSGDISGTGGLVKTGGGVFALTGASTYTGGTTISAGTLQLGNGGASGSILGNVTDNATLAFNRSDMVTFGGAISGTGAVTHLGAGLTVLTGPSTYTGGTTIASGVLRAGGGLALAPFSAFSIAAAATLDVNNFSQGIGSLAGAGHVTLGSATLTSGADNTSTLFSGDISGTGGLVKTGGGVFALTGASTYTGGTTISAGALQLGNGGASGSILGNVTDNATLAFNRSDLVVFAGSISGTGAVTHLGTGMTALTGANTFSGGTTIAAGTLLGTAASFGTGPILDNAALVIDQPVSAPFANAINGIGTLLKRGLGSLNLTGTSGLSGPTTIAAGRLAVNGALAQSIVTVQNGAVLGGNGKVGGIILQAGGAVAPGNSIGTLAVNGNFTAASGSLYLAELNATGQSDLIAATGTATIASGAQLQILKTDVAPFVPGTRYTLLTAAGGISGAYSFAAIQLSAFLGILPKYDATSLSLDIGKTSSFAAIGLTRNQMATGSGLDSLPPANPLSVAVAYLPSFAAGRAAFDQLAGEIHASAKTALVEGSHFVRDAAIDRIRQAFDSSAVGTQAIAVASSGPGPVTSPYAVWGRAYGSWGSTNSTASVARLDRSTGGFILGADAAIGDAWRIGILGGYGATSFSLVNRAQSGHSDNFEGAIYGGGQWSNFGLRLGLAHAWHDIGVNRSVTFAGFADHLSTSRRAVTTQAFGEIGYRIDVSGAAFEPFASLAAVQLHTDGFSERGGAAALRGRSTNQTTSFSTLGLRGSTSFALGDANLSARATLGWRHAFGRATPLQSASFAGGSAFVVAGTAIARDALTAETGLELQFGRDSLLAVTYSGQFARTARDQSLRGTFVQKF